MWNYLLIPLLLSLTINAQYTIRLPSQAPPSCPALDTSLNYRPVIGILSHPGDGASGRLSNETGVSHIAASYVKFVEAGGARVIPLIYNEPAEILERKLDLVNGVILIGGKEKRDNFFGVVKEIYNKTIEKNDAGDHFPLYAISLAFQLLTAVVDKNATVFEHLATKGQPSLLQFREGADSQGKLFQSFPPELLKKLSSDCIISQTDSYGSLVDTYQGDSDFSSFFEILTTSTDGDNKHYVSTAQAYKYPIVGFQWHPQKNAFEWGTSGIPHSEDAIRVTQLTANYLVSEARKSSNKPAAKEVLDNLIYNYSPVYGGKAGKGYDQVYIFAKP